MSIPQELYAQFLSQMPIFCVDAVVVHNGKVLLAYRNNKPAQHLWWVPGGRVLKDETLEQAILRKMKEELGVMVKIEKRLGTYETMFPDAPFREISCGVHTNNVAFLVTLANENDVINLDNQSSDYQWVDHLDEQSHPYLKALFHDAGVASFPESSVQLRRVNQQLPSCSRRHNLLSDELYAAVQEHLPVPSINLVVVDAGKVLLIQRQQEPEKGQWWVPGGRIIKHETLEQAARRIALGLGIIPKSIRLSETNEYIKSGVHHTSTCIIIEPLEVTIPSVIPYRWVSSVTTLPEYVRKVVGRSGVLS